MTAATAQASSAIITQPTSAFYPHVEGARFEAMRLLARLLVTAGVAVLLLPGRASAAVQTLSFTSAPITVTRFEVARGVQLVPSPKVDGYVVGMSAELVDPAGNPV